MNNNRDIINTDTDALCEEILCKFISIYTKFQLMNYFLESELY